jgi:hypothetical protein
MEYRNLQIGIVSLYIYLDCIGDLSISIVTAYYIVITYNHFKQAGGQSLLDKYGTMKNLLKSCLSLDYVPSNQNITKFYKAERCMTSILRTIFPNQLILERYHHPDIIFQSKQRGELDAYIGSLGLAFEYQGEIHFQGTALWGDGKDVKYHDQQKREACKRLGITLIEVPYWWDKSKKQLELAIWNIRPDLVKEPLAKGDPFPQPNKVRRSKNSDKGNTAVG